MKIKQTKSKIVTRDKEGHYVFIKGLRHQEYISINTYVPYNKSQNMYEAKIDGVKGKNRQLMKLKGKR